MALTSKLRKILEQQFPLPDKVELRNGDRIVGIITSKRFRRMDGMKRQDLIDNLLVAHLNEKEKRRIAIIVGVTPEEAIANSVPPW
jgi:acid stress-induced BolA-like protein IbaG/YrbA